MTAVTLPLHLPLNERIVWARKRRGISQERLAEMIGTSRRHMVRIEKGHVTKPGMPFLAAIAEATEQPLELFGQKDVAAEEDEESEAVRAMSLDDFLRHRIAQLVREFVVAAEGAA